MGKIELILCFAMATLPVAAGADRTLYLLSGPTFGEGIPVELFRLGGRASRADLVLNVAETTGFFCAPSLNAEERLFTVVEDSSTAATVHVLDMDRPFRPPMTVELSYGASAGKHRSCLDAFLLRNPDGRLMQAVEVGAEYTRFDPQLVPPVSDYSLLGVQIRPVATHPKLEIFPWQYAARIELSGAGWELGDRALPEVSVDSSGALSVVTMGPAPLPVRLDKPILEQVIQAPNQAFYIEVNTHDWMVLSRRHSKRSVPNGIGASFHDVFDRASASWHTFEVPGSASRLKNFGDWLAGTVVEGDSDRESPGRNHRPETRVPRVTLTGPPVLDILWKNLSEYSPGQLYLINAKTQRTYTIETNEGDSEVLLIDGATVYYRVNDSLFQAAIGPESVSAPILLAADPHVTDFHWAFLGPSAPTPAASRGVQH